MRKPLLCPFMSGSMIPVECDKDKCELWLKDSFVMDKHVEGRCGLYWSGLKARRDIVGESLGEVER